MTPICNDQLTRVRKPSYAASADFWEVPKVYRVGDKGDKNGMPYTIKHFGTLYRRRGGVAQIGPEQPRLVWLVIKYKGDRAHKWDCLLIGDTQSFRERIVLGGRHPNPIFTRYWPKGGRQPL